MFAISKTWLGSWPPKATRPKQNLITHMQIEVVERMLEMQDTKQFCNAGDFEDLFDFSTSIGRTAFARVTGQLVRRGWIKVDILGQLYLFED